MAPDILRLICGMSDYTNPFKPTRYGIGIPWFEQKRKERKKARMKKKMNGRNGHH